MSHYTSLALQIPASLLNRLEQLADTKNASLDEIIVALLEEILAQEGQPPAEAGKLSPDSASDNS